MLRLFTFSILFNCIIGTVDTPLNDESNTVEIRCEGGNDTKLPQDDDTRDSSKRSLLEGEGFPMCPRPLVSTPVRVF